MGMPLEQLDVVADIRARLRAMNAELRRNADAQEALSRGDAAKSKTASAKLIEKDAAKMVNDIEYRTEYHAPNTSAHVSRLTAGAFQGEAIVLFWRGFSREKKAQHVREFVDCEFVEWAAADRDAVYAALFKELRAGRLDSRVQWNGYHIEKLLGFVAERRATSKTAPPTVHVEFQCPGDKSSGDKSRGKRPGMSGETVAKPKRCTTAAKHSSATLAGALSVRNLRMQIERQKIESGMRLRGELDEDDDDASSYGGYYRPYHSRR